MKRARLGLLLATSCALGVAIGWGVGRASPSAEVDKGRSAEEVKVAGHGVVAALTPNWELLRTLYTDEGQLVLVVDAVTRVMDAPEPLHSITLRARLTASDTVVAKDIAQLSPVGSMTVPVGGQGVVSFKFPVTVDEADSILKNPDLGLRVDVTYVQVESAAPWRKPGAGLSRP